MSQVSLHLSSPLDRLMKPVGTTLGQLAFAALTVVTFSGILLGVLYDPGAPLASTEAIQGAIAYGWLLRAAHVLSAQLFVVTLLLHTLDHVWARSYRQQTAGAWWRLVLAGGLGMGAMFTGFLLRGDAEARAAHSIAGSLLGSIPGVGGDLSRFLLGEPDQPLQAALLHHVATFTLSPWLLAIEHARRAWAGLLVTLVVLAGVTALALLIHPGPGSLPGED